MNMPFCFYGTLMEYGSRGERMTRAHWLNDLGSYGPACKIPGYLYDLGAFPALVPGDGIVEGQLWYPGYGWAEEATRIFDRIESYHPDRPDESMYLRQLVRLIEPDTDAYVYIWNGRPRGRLIENGSWLNRDFLYERGI